MKPARFIIAGDSHGDMISEVSEKAILAFIADYKPEIRIHLGDAFDFRNLRKGASDDEKAASLEDDWNIGSEFLRRFFDGGKDNHFLRGNHDERIFDLKASAVGVMRDFATDGCKRFEQLVKRCNAKMLPYDSRLGVLRIGSLKVVHGYSAGRNACSVHARVYRNCFFGHVHTIEAVAVESDEGEKECRSIGCLCNTDMPYNARHTNKLRHRNGFVYGLLFPDGTYQHWQAARLGNSFYAAQNIKTY